MCAKHAAARENGRKRRQARCKPQRGYLPREDLQRGMASILGHFQQRIADSPQ
jgi:hypothetical protein